MFVYFNAVSQNNEWRHYFPNQSINTITIENEIIWAGSEKGLLKLDTKLYEIYIYDTLTSGISSNRVFAIAIDEHGNKWVGTENGLCLFNGSSWTIFNKNNSGIPANKVTALALDKSGNKWIGTEQGLVKFDDKNWTIYNSFNSDIPENFITSIQIDSIGIKWIGTFSQGLATYNDKIWKIYNNANSYIENQSIHTILIHKVHITNYTLIGNNIGLVLMDDQDGWTIYYNNQFALPDSIVTSIAIEDNEIIWVGTEKGIGSRQHSAWIVLNMDNSELPNNKITSIAIDKYGNKWIGNSNGGGLSVFKEGGVLATIKNEKNISSVIFPNPLLDNSTVKLRNNKKVIRGNFLLYNFLGEEVQNIKFENSTFIFSKEKITSGIYLYRIIEDGQILKSDKVLIE